MLSWNVHNYYIGDRQFIEKKKCYNVNVPVTMFKYLPFSAGKTAHLDRLCLENSLKESRPNVGRLFVCLLLKKLYYD